jgi:alkylated DNA repair dioxygenase AlkB
MDKLFDILPSGLPPGFSYTENFITENEERQLLQVISGLELHTFIFRGYEAKRKVASFGYDYNFNNRSISEGKEIPPGFNFLIEKVAKETGISASEFAELLVIEYPPESVINWHRDAPPFELIAGISLLSDCTFKLRPYNKEQQGKKYIRSVPVKKRSLYIMQGESRSEWEHSIDKTKTLRYSITLRTLRNT